MFEKALNLAKVTGAHLMLLHVLSTEEEGYPDLPMVPSVYYYPGLSDVPLDLYREQWEAFEQKGLEHLKRWAETATQAGVKTEFTQTPGSPGRIICNLARTWNADLVLVGSRGRSGLGELLLGSVSNFVTHHSPCSVLIVRTPKTAAQDQQDGQDTEVASLLPS